ncbi:MAG: hypothetical protein K0Q87_4114 [Neobacillus sp.]|jgi:uncharacterized membrane protein YciS (DUF1049 family)|nr:hypothetical protein [Neobacillus sp.]
MKVSRMLIILLISAWPLYILYTHSLGAISFLLLAIFFLVMAIKEMKALKEVNKTETEIAKPEKIRRNSR